MNNREQFEAWCASMGFPLTRVRYETWQAAKATCPAWHDAPTVPGLWVCVDKLNGALTYTVTPANLTLSHNVGDRWYGPIPEDKS